VQDEGPPGLAHGRSTVSRSQGSSVRRSITSISRPPRPALRGLERPRHSDRVGHDRRVRPFARHAAPGPAAPCTSRRGPPAGERYRSLCSR
jgi:hypothetical protein